MEPQLAITLTSPTLLDADTDNGDENLCHVAVTGSDRLALCGATIESAAGDPGDAPHRGIVVNGFCSGCNRKICVTCESLNDRNLLLLGAEHSS